MENTLMKSPPELLQVVEKSGLADHQKAQVYVQLFAPNLARLSELEEQILKINAENPTAEDAAKARELRLLYVKNRTASEKTKDETKKNLLVETNLIQSLYNVVLNASKLKEEHLAKIEKHQEIAEAKMKAERLQVRLKKLQPFTKEGEAIPEQLIAEMNDEMFATYLGGVKTKCENEKAEAKRIEEERVKKEEEEKQQRALMQAENDRLKKEAEEKQKKDQEREALQKKRFGELLPVYNQESKLDLTTLFELAEKDFQTILSNHKKAYEKKQAQLKKEKDVADETNRKLKEAQELVRKEREEAERLEEEKLNMGDKDKFNELLRDLAEMQIKYTFKSKKHKQIYSGISELLGKTITYAKEKLQSK